LGRLINGPFFLKLITPLSLFLTVRYKIKTCYYSRELFSISRSRWTSRLRWLVFWDCGFESLLEQGRLSLFNVLSFQAAISATGRFLVQRNRSECGVSECDREVSIIWWPWPTRVCCVTKHIFYLIMYVFISLSKDSFVP
jgi:hypothetical protein